MGWASCVTVPQPHEEEPHQLEGGSEGESWPWPPAGKAVPRRGDGAGRELEGRGQNTEEVRRQIEGF